MEGSWGLNENSVRKALRKPGTKLAVQNVIYCNCVAFRDLILIQGSLVVEKLNMPEELFIHLHMSVFKGSIWEKFLWEEGLHLERVSSGGGNLQPRTPSPCVHDWFLLSFVIHLLWMSFLSFLWLTLIASFSYYAIFKLITSHSSFPLHNSIQRVWSHPTPRPIFSWDGARHQRA